MTTREQTLQLISQPTLDKAKIEAMLAHMLRSRVVFHAAKSVVIPAHFSAQDEAPHRAIWASALRLEAHSRMLPAREMLTAETLQELQRDTYITGGMARNDARNLLEWVWSDSGFGNEFADTTALDWLREFLEERAVQNRLRDAFENTPGLRISNIADLLNESASRMREAVAMCHTADTSAFPDEWTAGMYDVVPTDIPCIDSRLGGGAAPGEVNVLLAPTGGGKTVAATHLVVTAARRQSVTPNGGLAVFVSYEAPLDEMRCRVISNAARIQWTRLMRIRSFADLTRRGSLLPYERDAMAELIAMGADPPGERERLATARYEMDEHLQLMDLSGAGDDPGGAGGVQELRGRLEQLSARRNKRIAFVVVDWAGALVRRWMDAKSIDTNMTTAHLSQLADKLRIEVASAFHCPLFLTHQLRGGFLEKGSQAMPTHADAENCKSFANNASFALCIGAMERDLRVARFGATKTRRSVPTSHGIIRIGGDYCEIVEATSEFALSSRGIVPADDAMIVAADRNPPAIISDAPFAAADFEPFSSVDAGADEPVT